jgi:hypothetical protein
MRAAQAHEKTPRGKLALDGNRVRGHREEKQEFIAEDAEGAEKTMLFCLFLFISLRTLR